MELEHANVFDVSSTMEDKTSGVWIKDLPNRFGLDARRFRDFVLDLVLSGFVVGYVRHVTSNYITEDRLDRERGEMIEQLIAGQHVRLQLSHRGRVRMWTLRDALLRDPDLEPMGLRSKAAWERALPVQLKWASAETPLSIIFLDLDDFGVVNKQLGSSVGDDVLRATFNVVNNFIGVRGGVYRFGGEELGVLLPNVAQEPRRRPAICATRQLSRAFDGLIEARPRGCYRRTQTALDAY
jgi:GGDEF domain-containing protein